ncbi:MAG TPA: permease-like cell division protein FtsX [Patescibacteria group bacterium]|nr:permease-like cell division protein FtsX [Patescibacteria group bacterium]
MAKTFRTSWNHIRRSPYQSFAAIFIMLQTFFVITLFAFIFVGSARIINYFESQPKVTIFFKDTAKQSDIDALESQLKATGKVSNMRFVSKEEAFKTYQQWNKDQPILLDLVTADVLPASLEIATTNIDDLSSIAQLVNASPIKDNVTYPKDVITNLVSWTNALRKIGIVVIAFLTLDAIFLMMIIIGIKVSHKRQEIEIMRLLSATNGYIRWPFLVEGVSYGVIGAVIGFITATSILLYASPFLASYLGDASLIPTQPEFLLLLFAGELFVAVLLGCLSSFLAVLRYLK